MNNEKPNRQPKPIYNPLREDFSVNYALDDGPSVTYIIHGMEIETFPTYLADHISKHLAQKIVSVRGIKTNYEDEYKNALHEILDIDLKV